MFRTELEHDQYYVTLNSDKTKIISAHKVLATAHTKGRRRKASFVAVGWTDKAPSDVANSDIKILPYKDWKVFVDLRTVKEIEGSFRGWSMVNMDSSEYIVTLDKEMTEILGAHKVRAQAQMKKGAAFLATGWRGRYPLGETDKSQFKILAYTTWEMYVDLRTVEAIGEAKSPIGDVLKNTRAVESEAMKQTEWEEIAVKEVSPWCRIVTEEMTIRPGVQVLRDIIMIGSTPEDEWVAD